MKNFLIPKPARRSYQDEIIDSMDYIASISPVTDIVIKKTYRPVINAQSISTYLVMFSPKLSE